ncbi:MAG: 23S rRNA (adenine(2503)-C(2))-methyltransferase RlmN [Chloroflexi bacterium]|jgi:23S rRNA (adenine2503-C2)-methyltransferase|nr:23S rRNA (adenine(2503)-C(2))-methyltransferase RlmN [Anaerolineaceae bacterium]NLI43872.1 23S rRNA (adenine(2503)-C(2))-methyltransferase RlmN [Chloroflexota bacterium]HOE35752.1 23S rRNA (adenine(2503)-C(2))-methyltransferase RlmN [Anaerolineaceae bacterium]HQK03109.1 23S rRNA (adenine(2503)-C(2))-methyltransferase RlmN [Anaerolineaceae bacterium]
MADALIYDLDFEELVQALNELGQPLFRARQIWSGLYEHLYDDFSQFSNIPSNLRTALAQRYTLSPLSPRASLHSKDRLTEKTLFGLHDNLSVETVLMRYEERNSLCISTQVGCPMGCVFCATGQMGYQRGLSTGEILAQVIHYMRHLQTEGKKLTNIVYMGMGEPFLNYDATMASLRRLTDSTGMNFGARRITISTVGIIPKIEKFSRESLQVNLAVSLHSADNELRSQIVPANRIYPLKNLISACRAYTELTHRRISFEYALIKDLNDTQPAAAQLAGLLKGMLCHVNLIALNPSKAYPLQGSSKEKVQAFADALAERGIPVTVRLRRGIEIQAGCGQLASSQNPL